MTKVKICGVTNLDDALMAADAGADALGFIFYKKSPRYIAPRAAKKIIERLPPLVQTVGVFVQTSTEDVNKICGYANVALAQEHSDAATIKEIRKLQPRVIKAFRVGASFQASTVETFYKQTGVKNFLFDAFDEKAFGGTGRRIDIEKAAELIQATATFGYAILAGGLTAENVRNIARAVRPYGVDVSSGVEKSVGKKDAEKVRRFIEQAKSA